MAQWIGKILPALNGTARPKASVDAELAKRTPALCELLTCAEFGGKERKTASLLVYAEQGAWKACLRDRETEHFAFITADSFWGVLECLEAALTSNTLDWRKDGQKPWQKNGK